MCYINTVSVPKDVDTFLGNSNEYTQVHVQYPYMTMSPDSYIPIIELQLKLCTHIGIVYYCENIC